MTDHLGNEVHALSGSNLDSFIPAWQDERWWIRWPASVVHHLGTFEESQGLRSKGLLREIFSLIKRDYYFDFLLLFVPFSIAAAHLGWSDKYIFSLSLLALVGLEVFTSSMSELLCLSLGNRASIIGAEFIPNVFPTMVSRVPSSFMNAANYSKFGVILLLSNDSKHAGEFIIGSFLSNILLVCCL